MGREIGKNSFVQEEGKGGGDRKKKRVCGNEVNSSYGVKAEQLLITLELRKRKRGSLVFTFLELLFLCRRLKKKKERKKEKNFVAYLDKHTGKRIR